MNKISEQNPEEKIAQILIKKKLVLSIAESCTGGLISSRLTDISGSSAYTKQNFVTYSNEAKQKYLGVKASTLKKYGAVSEKVVREMAQGLLKKTNADITLSISGIAGPKSDDTQKPVGLVYICVADDKHVEVKEFKASPTSERTKIKHLFSEEALKFLLEFLKKYY